MAYVAIALIYLGLKIWLRRMAIRMVTQDFDSAVDAMIPSAFVPWQFLGFRNVTSEEQEIAQVISVDLLRNRTNIQDIPIYDSQHVSALQDLPEYQVMRELSPGYHVVQVEANGNETRVVCRDLRTRNFGTQFGVLEVVLDPESKPVQVEFNV